MHKAHFTQSQFTILSHTILSTILQPPEGNSCLNLPQKPWNTLAAPTRSSKENLEDCQEGTQSEESRHVQSSRWYAPSALLNRNAYADI
ncbi:hypothetical protein AVEN_206812-1 [Araneus ventricosus]|uniref:Uncharacterized protein n=1 Tax=Araneus ventricosus TaxID=182803 RepID=A0A4Y2C4U8_ARAVE|nr:hypothetical protein AVEN_206812-1 [Araneus ventricosus]